VTTWLVTGGAGFIGSNFVRHWLHEHPQDRVINLDALTYAGNLESLADLAEQPGYRFVRGDIGDRQLVTELFEREGIDTVVNFAAESHVDRSILGPRGLHPHQCARHLPAAGGWRALLWGANCLAECRFLHVSTDEVYGSLGPDDAPFTETTAYAPNSPYSASKAASDHLVRAYHETYGMPVLTTNCSNNYGPYQFPEKLIPLVILNALEGKVSAHLRRRPQHPRLALRGGPLPGHRRGAAGRPGGGDLQRSAAPTRCRTSRSCTRCATSWTN
jgi:dTDP-glucose 4,6-dehydratase